MYYSKKEQNWLFEMYDQGYTYTEIYAMHNARVNFPARSKAALQKYISRYYISAIRSLGNAR